MRQQQTTRTGRYLVCGFAIALLLATSANAEAPRGDYLESRTCDVYTGPCFANGQIGLAGREAILAWSIDQGSYRGVDLAGLKVGMAIRAADTLGFGGGLVIHPDPIRSVILVDEQANPAQREALAEFAREKAGRLSGDVTRIDAVPITMAVDHVEMVGQLKAGELAEIETRKLGRGDCHCSNEIVFYPPLTPVENFEPAFTVVGGFRGRGLGGKWEAPLTRSAFLATFGE
jgi:hypothetical protein